MSLCHVCDRHDLAEGERQTCVYCLGRARANLLALVDAWALLPAELTDRGGTSFDPIPTGARETPIPGGEALVLLTGGNLTAADPYVLPGDPISPLPVLAAWVSDWRARFGTHDDLVTDEAGAIDRAHNLAELVGYLDRMLGWAAQHHPDFAGFCSDTHRLRTRIEAVTHTLEPIDRGAGIPCPECGEPLIRYYGDPQPCPHVTQDGPESPREPISGVWRRYGTPPPRRRAQNGAQGSDSAELWQPCGCDQGGRRDTWRCPNRACGRSVDDRQYHFALWAHLEGTT